MIMYWTLDKDHRPVPMEPPIDYKSETWARIWDEEYRRVGSDDIEGWYVSTVFLAIDHGFSPGSPPTLWETMIFDKRDGEETWGDWFQWRYTSWADAERGHALACDIVRTRLIKGLPLLITDYEPPA